MNGSCHGGGEGPAAPVDRSGSGVSDSGPPPQHRASASISSCQRSQQQQTSKRRKIILQPPPPTKTNSRSWEDIGSVPLDLEELLRSKTARIQENPLRNGSPQVASTTLSGPTSTQQTDSTNGNAHPLPPRLSVPFLPQGQGQRVSKEPRDGNQQPAKDHEREERRGDRGTHKSCLPSKPPSRSPCPQPLGAAELSSSVSRSPVRRGGAPVVYNPMAVAPATVVSSPRRPQLKPNDASNAAKSGALPSPHRLSASSWPEPQAKVPTEFAVEGMPRPSKPIQLSERPKPSDRSASSSHTPQSPQVPSKAAAKASGSESESFPAWQQPKETKSHNGAAVPSTGPLEAPQGPEGAGEGVRAELQPPEEPLPTVGGASTPTGSPEAPQGPEQATEGTAAQPQSRAPAAVPSTVPPKASEGPEQAAWEMGAVALPSPSLQLPEEPPPTVRGASTSTGSPTALQERQGATEGTAAEAQSTAGAAEPSTGPPETPQGTEAAREQLSLLSHPPDDQRSSASFVMISTTPQEALTIPEEAAIETVTEGQSSAGGLLSTTGPSEYPLEREAAAERATLVELQCPLQPSGLCTHPPRVEGSTCRVETCSPRAQESGRVPVGKRWMDRLMKPRPRKDKAGHAEITQAGGGNDSTVEVIDLVEDAQEEERGVGVWAPRELQRPKPSEPPSVSSVPTDSLHQPYPSDTRQEVVQGVREEQERLEELASREEHAGMEVLTEVAGERGSGEAGEGPGATPTPSRAGSWGGHGQDSGAHAGAARSPGPRDCESQLEQQVEPSRNTNIADSPAVAVEGHPAGNHRRPRAEPEEAPSTLGIPQGTAPNITLVKELCGLQCTDTHVAVTLSGFERETLCRARLLKPLWQCCQDHNLWDYYKTLKKQLEVLRPAQAADDTPAAAATQPQHQPQPQPVHQPQQQPQQQHTQSQPHCLHQPHPPPQAQPLHQPQPQAQPQPQPQAQQCSASQGPSTAMNKLALCYRVLSQNARKEDNSLRCKNSLQILSNLHKLQNAVVSLRNEWMKEVNDLQNRVKDVRVSQVNKSFALQAIDERCKLLLGPMSILEKQIENLTGEIQRHIDTRKRVEAARSSRSAGQSNPRQQQQNVPQQQLGQREQRQQPRQLLRSSTSISQHPPQFQTQAEIGGTTSIDPQLFSEFLQNRDEFLQFIQMKKQSQMTQQTLVEQTFLPAQATQGLPAQQPGRNLQLAGQQASGMVHHRSLPPSSYSAAIDLTCDDLFSDPFQMQWSSAQALTVQQQQYGVSTRQPWTPQALHPRTDQVSTLLGHHQTGQQQLTSLQMSLPHLQGEQMFSSSPMINLQQQQGGQVVSAWPMLGLQQQRAVALPESSLHQQPQQQPLALHSTSIQGTQLRQHWAVPATVFRSQQQTIPAVSQICQPFHAEGGQESLSPSTAPQLHAAAHSQQPWVLAATQALQAPVAHQLQAPHTINHNSLVASQQQPWPQISQLPPAQLAAPQQLQAQQQIISTQAVNAYPSPSLSHVHQQQAIALAGSQWASPHPLGPSPAALHSQQLLQAQARMPQPPHASPLVLMQHGLNVPCATLQATFPLTAQACSRGPVAEPPPSTSPYAVLPPAASFGNAEKGGGGAPAIAMAQMTLREEDIMGCDAPSVISPPVQAAEGRAVSPPRTQQDDLEPWRHRVLPVDDWGDVGGSAIGEEEPTDCEGTPSPRETTGQSWYHSLKNRMKGLLNAVKDFDVKNAFLNPVTEDIAPGYSREIKNPICISEIEAKVSGEEYFKLHGTPESAVAAFRSDLELMVSNCLEYNPVGNPYHKLGRDMGDYISPMLELLESGLSNSKAQ